MIQHITKTTRTFPSNLYNKLEERLKNNNSNKGNTAKITPIQEIETQIKCPKCGRMVDRAKVVKKEYICYLQFIMRDYPIHVFTDKGDMSDFQDNDYILTISETELSSELSEMHYEQIDSSDTVVLWKRMQ